MQTILIPFGNAILQQLSPDYIPAEQSARRGRKGEAEITVQTSQVIFVMEKSKTPVSLSNTDDAVAEINYKREATFHTLRLVFIMVSSAQR